MCHAPERRADRGCGGSRGDGPLPGVSGGAVGRGSAAGAPAAGPFRGAGAWRPALGPLLAEGAVVAGAPGAAPRPRRGAALAGRHLLAGGAGGTGALLPPPRADAPAPRAGPGSKSPAV